MQTKITIWSDSRQAKQLDEVNSIFVLHISDIRMNISYITTAILNQITRYILNLLDSAFILYKSDRFF